MTPTDPSLIAREEAITKLRLSLLGFVRRRGLTEYAEDITHDTLLVLARRYPGVSDPLELISLSTKICRLIIANFVGRKKEQQEDDFSLRESPSNLELEIQFTEVLWAIERLCAKCRELLHLRRLGFTSNEIATKQKRDVNAVNTAYHRCIQDLKLEMGQK